MPSRATLVIIVGRTARGRGRRCGGRVGNPQSTMPPSNHASTYRQGGDRRYRMLHPFYSCLQCRMAWKDSSRLSNSQPFTAAHRAKVQEALSSAFLACLMFAPPHLFPLPARRGCTVHFGVFDRQKAFNENSHPTRCLIARKKKLPLSIAC